MALGALRLHVGTYRSPGMPTLSDRRSTAADAGSLRAVREQDRDRLNALAQRNCGKATSVRHFQARVCHLCSVSLGNVFFAITQLSVH